MISSTTQQRYKEQHDNSFYQNINLSKRKQCSCCKKRKPLYEFSRHSKQKDGFTYRCKKCIKQGKINLGINLAFTKHNAKLRGLEFNISREDLFLPKYCPILGIKLNYSASKVSDNSPSIDRIDNSKGYIKGNVIVVSRLANAMKNSATFEQLKLFSTNILKIISYYENKGFVNNIVDIFPNIEKRDTV